MKTKLINGIPAKPSKIDFWSTTSVLVAHRVEFLQKLHHCSFEAAVRHSLAVGNFITRQQPATFYINDQPVELPKPVHIRLEPCAPSLLRVYMMSDLLAVWESLSEKHLIDKHSVLGWAALCAITLDTASKTQRVTARRGRFTLEYPAKRALHALYLR
jgi:hypothetical protein